jgi:hypothetical protein
MERTFIMWDMIDLFLDIFFGIAKEFQMGCSKIHLLINSELHQPKYIEFNHHLCIMKCFICSVIDICRRLMFHFTYAISNYILNCSIYFHLFLFNFFALWCSFRILKYNMNIIRWVGLIHWFVLIDWMTKGF